MKTILVGVDFAPESARVVETALSLATVSKARIVFLHVVSHINAAFDYGFCDPGVFRSEKEIMDMKARIEELSNDAREAGVNVVSEVLEGYKPYIIMQRARAYKVDLIVLGQHAHKVFHDLFGASVSQAISRTCEFPVLLVPIGTVEEEEIGRIKAKQSTS